MLQNYLLYVILPLLSISGILVFTRFLKGPYTIDRVVSLDFLINIGIAIIAVYSIVTDHSSFLDVAMILALIAFLGTIALSYYLEQRGKKQ
ncbi:MAG: cation:proton antiporter [Spirosomataceae bacterium]